MGLSPLTWPREWLVAIALAAVAIAVVQAAWSAVRKALRRRAVLARVSRAGEGEALAAALLEDLGYAIVATQASTTYDVCVDGAPVAAGLRADYLVERGGARFVAEVKTGAVAPKITTPATRRQLLEYRVAFDVDGVLLVDAERRRVSVVTFPRLEERVAGGRPAVAWVVFAVAIVVATASAAVALAR